MIDEPPALDDSWSSLLRLAAWIYRRGFTSFVVIWAVLLLPFDLIAAVYRQSLPRGALMPLLPEICLMLPSVFYGVVATAVAAAVLENSATPARDAFSLALRRTPAMVWTDGLMLLRVALLMLPLGIIGGMTAKLHGFMPVLVIAAAAVSVAYLLVRWALATAVVLFDSVSGGDALRLAGRLAGRRFWLLTINLIASLLPGIAVAVIFVWGFAWALSSVGAPSWFFELLSLSVSGVTAAPFMCAIYLALYRREAAFAAPVPEVLP